MIITKSFIVPLNLDNTSSLLPIRQLFSEVADWLVSLNLGFVLDGIKYYGSYTSFRLKYKNNPHMMVLYSHNHNYFIPFLSRANVDLNVDKELNSLFYIQGGTSSSLDINNTLQLNLLVVGNSDNCVVMFGTRQTYPDFTSSSSSYFVFNFASVTDYITNEETSIVNCLMGASANLSSSTSSGYMHSGDTVFNRRMNSTSLLDSSDIATTIRYIKAGIANTNYVYKNMYNRSAILLPLGSTLTVNEKTFLILHSNSMFEV